MFRDRLLERIRARERHPGEREGWDPASEVGSIVRHLSRMLNSRQGGVPIAAGYGIPDFTNVPGETLTEMAQDMQRAIRSVVMEFEPRLTNVSVSFDPLQTNVLSLRFRVQGALMRDPKVPVTLETTISSEGKARVES